MPKVGSKHFAYTPAGQQQAAAHSRATGQPMVNTGYKKGGKASKAKGGAVKKAKGGRVKAMGGGMKMYKSKKK